MLTFEVINELTLKVTCRGNDVLFTKAGSFICGENGGQKNYKFEKLLLGPQQSVGQALLGSLMRRVTGENLPLMKVMMNGDSVTYYANHAQHVVVYQLQPGEVLSIESENILAFTPDCKYDVRFIGCGVISQKGLATSTLTGEGPNAYVAILIDGPARAAEPVPVAGFAAGAVRVATRPLDGDFAAQRNALQGLARHRWMLQLDADEALAPETGRLLPALAALAEAEDVVSIGLARANRVDGIL